jgi:predicted house-cleaning noncanonical NTP pyrophosphatase (MazG superfamily)
MCLCDLQTNKHVCLLASHCASIQKGVILDSAISDYFQEITKDKKGRRHTKNKMKDLLNYLKKMEPKLLEEVEEVIKDKEKDYQTIERHLDYLLTGATVGIGKNAFQKLNDYYRTLNPQGAEWYQKHLNDLLDN